MTAALLLLLAVAQPCPVEQWHRAPPRMNDGFPAPTTIVGGVRCEGGIRWYGLPEPTIWRSETAGVCYRVNYRVQTAVSKRDTSGSTGHAVRELEVVPCEGE